MPSERQFEGFDPAVEFRLSDIPVEVQAVEVVESVEMFGLRLPAHACTAFEVWKWRFARLDAGNGGLVSGGQHALLEYATEKTTRG